MLSSTFVDEMGYLPFEPQAAHLFFQLVSRRYERGSILITSNRSVGEWGEVFGDAVVATAILDRLLPPQSRFDDHGRELQIAREASCRRPEALGANACQPAAEGDMSTRPAARRARTPASTSASPAIVSSGPGRPVDSAVAWKTRMRRSARTEPSSSARLPHHLDAADGAHRTNRHRRPCSRTPDHQNDVDVPSRHRRNVAAFHFRNIRRFFGGQFSMSPRGQF